MVNNEQVGAQAGGTCQGPAPSQKVEVPSANKQYVVRCFDYFDGWFDVTGPVSREGADRELSARTQGGTEHTHYTQGGHYYQIFPANTSMVYRAEVMDK